MKTLIEIDKTERRSPSWERRKDRWGCGTIWLARIYWLFELWYFLILCPQGIFSGTAEQWGNGGGGQAFSQWLCILFCCSFLEFTDPSCSNTHRPLPRTSFLNDYNPNVYVNVFTSYSKSSALEMICYTSFLLLCWYCECTSHLRLHCKMNHY